MNIQLQLIKLFQNNRARRIIPIVVIISVSITAWYRVLSFWFFKGYEASWLYSVPHTFFGLFRAHAYIYYFNYLVFGWNPYGWYMVSIILHTLTVIIFYQFLIILTKKREVAFIGSIIMVANIAYHDVLTWGSFNSYYSLMMLFIFISLLTFIKYQHYKRISNIIISVICAFLAFYVRESGMALIPVIIVLYLLFFRKKTFYKTIFSLGIQIFPYIVVLLLYFLIRSKLGDVVGDYADDNVQLRIKLLKDGMYGALFLRTIVAFGRHYASLWIPYPWLNHFREFLFAITKNNSYILLYTFSVIGWIELFCLSVFVFLKRNSRYFIYYFFAILWTCIWIGLTAYAIPSTDTVLSQEYLWNTRRYAYFAFFGVSLFSALFIIDFSYKFQKDIRRYVVYFIASGIVLVNILWLWSIQQELFTTVHKQTRAFYTDFKRLFPTLPNNTVIYQYPYSYGLNDLLYEWSFTKDTDYPNLKNDPFMTENQLARVLEKIARGIYAAQKVIFLEYNPLVGLIDRTKDVNNYVQNAKVFKFNTNTSFLLEPNIYPVEIPYEIIFSAKSLALKDNEADFEGLNKLINFSNFYGSYVMSSSVEVSATMSQRPGEPFRHFDPKHLTDGNIGLRYGWVADSIPAIVTIDIKSPYSIQGLFWISENSPRKPGTYTISVSTDKITWKNIKTIKNVHELSSAIIPFDSPVEARYVKISIDTTVSGAFAELQEIGVIPTSDSEFIFSTYTDSLKLLYDVKRVSGSTFSWGEIEWNTYNQDVNRPTENYQIPFYSDSTYHTYLYVLPEMEIFSTNNEFLKRFIKSISIEPIGNHTIQISDGVLKPLYEIFDSKQK